ncbi:ComF family protein [Thiolapillus sp.]|uniref:ComF family protein n=1 Tax=Thiolapillus sp. TaxID=2017437 RepID=UPI0025FB680F|nr:ComF family protein [Thiolapillus sp.]
MVYNWQRLLFPPTCLICGLPGENDLDICDHCRSRLPCNRLSCACCALPLTGQTDAGVLCGNCSRHPPPFHRIISPWLYEAPLDDLIQQLKFGQKLPAGQLLAQLLAGMITERDRPELLLPVPLHPAQLKKRGFNHAAEISRVLSRELGIPWSPWLLRKTRETLPQHNLGKRERKRNLRNCFSFDNRRHYRHVAVIDDVVTTATTAAEVASTLKKSGVEKTDIWALARTPTNR